jgi:hypothetical protein
MFFGKEMPEREIELQNIGKKYRILEVMFHLPLPSFLIQGSTPKSYSIVAA